MGTLTQMWSRCCQECGHIQTAVQPEYGTEPTDSYRGSKCRKCKSEALDYGRTRTYDLDAKKFVAEED